MLKTRYEEMEEQAVKFHNKHPQIWELFCQFTFELINKGFKNYSAQHGIFARIRWHIDTATSNRGKAFKINNNYSAFYARWFMEKFPEHKGFFRKRTQLSKSQPATNLPELSPKNYTYVPGVKKQ